jgi:hypothetical protein
VGLSETRRVTFYEFVTALLKAVDALVNACPAETALAPVGRMDMMRKSDSRDPRLTTVVRFYDVLENSHRNCFDAGTSPEPQPRVFIHSEYALPGTRALLTLNPKSGLRDTMGVRRFRVVRGCSDDPTTVGKDS